MNLCTRSKNKNKTIVCIKNAVTKFAKMCEYQIIDRTFLKERRYKRISIHNGKCGWKNETHKIFNERSNLRLKYFKKPQRLFKKFNFYKNKKKTHKIIRTTQMLRKINLKNLYQIKFKFKKMVPLRWDKNAFKNV
jgi:hypothetical protein